MSLPAVLQGRVRTLGGGEEPACRKAALRRSQAGLPGPAGRACQAVRRLVGLQKLLPPLQDARREEETRRRGQRRVKWLPSPTALPSGPRTQIRGRSTRNAAHTGEVTGKSVRFSPARSPVLGRRQDTPCAAKSAASTKSDGVLPRPTFLFGRKSGENKHKKAPKVAQPSVQGLQTFRQRSTDLLPRRRQENHPRGRLNGPRKAQKRRGSLRDSRQNEQPRGGLLVGVRGRSPRPSPHLFLMSRRPVPGHTRRDDADSRHRADAESDSVQPA